MDFEAGTHDLLERLLLDQSAEPRVLPLTLLRAITNGFSDDRKIGGGGFATVYKGRLRNGTVAVKRLSRSLVAHNEPIFNNEVESLMRVKHENIVRCLGYCAETQGKMTDYKGKLVTEDVNERLLCFEYLPRGSLDAYITDASRGLDWRKRYKIIKGVCEGLDYLHQNRIVHLGLEPHNILLNNKMVPKVIDFGLSMRFDEDKDEQITENITGLPGYMAPEFSTNGVVSFKADIYSFGAVITKILAGRNGYSDLQKILESWSDRLGTSAEDTRLEQVRVCAEIGISCLDINPENRPDTRRILERLVETESMEQFTEPDEMESVDEFTELDEETVELNVLERIVAGTEEPSHLHLTLLEKITENFSERKKIGHGGCGDVYKGSLHNGVVAVKRLFKSRTIKDKMFHREVKSLITVRHENIVRFLGYCSVTEERAVKFQGRTIMMDIRERLLCFEYISNGSLENHITDELRGLKWNTRYEIILGICKGLLYLHKEKDIIHMDLKPANILLDDRMVPKITDFGLSRFDNNSQAATTSRLVSPGYCAPEYFLEGLSSSNADIYSLGVIITELVTGSKSKPDLTKVLRRWRHMWIKSSKHLPLGYQQVTKCLELAQRCVQIKPSSRPDISDVTNEFNAIDTNKDGQFQLIPFLLEDILAIEPLEIHIPFELDHEITHSMELSNDTDDHIAFMTKFWLRGFHTEPDMGIVRPRSKCTVTITVQAKINAPPNDLYKKITVLSSRVDGSLAAMDITGDMFIDKEGKVVDEVNVMLVFGRPPLAEDS